MVTTNKLVKCWYQSSFYETLTEKCIPVDSLVNVHQLRARAGLVFPVSVSCAWVCLNGIVSY